MATGGKDLDDMELDAEAFKQELEALERERSKSLVDDRAQPKITRSLFTDRDKLLRPDSDDLDGMIQKLRASGRYRVIPVDDDHEPVTSTRYRTMRHSTMRHSTDFTPTYKPPKISLFSGEEPVPKSEVSFDVWRYEVRCLRRDDLYPEVVIAQAIRRSLRGQARRILLPLGEDTTSFEILRKLDGVFGSVSSGEAILQEFYTEHQRSDESVASWGCRLEEMLQKAIDKGHVKEAARNDMLKSKFWRSLCSDRLKNATRHKYDSINDFDKLRREVRAIEEELSCHDKVAKLRQVNAKQTEVNTQSSTRTQPTSQLDAITSKLESMMKRMSEFEKKLDRVITGNQQTKPVTASSSNHNRNSKGWGRHKRQEIPKEAEVPKGNLN